MSELLLRAQELVRNELTNDQPRRYAHLLGAYQRSAIAARLFAKDDAKILRIASLVHDIGYSSSAVETGLHALDGARFLQKKGFPERICNLVAHHSCAYQEAKLRGLSSNLVAWEDEQTTLRDALWWVDMTTSPDGSGTTFSRRVSEIRERYGPDALVTRFIQQASLELRGAVERTEKRLSLAEFDQV